MPVKIQDLFHKFMPARTHECGHTVKPEKNTTIKFHENALKQFSRRLKFTNLASEPQKNSTFLYFLNV